MGIEAYAYRPGQFAAVKAAVSGCGIELNYDEIQYEQDFVGPPNGDVLFELNTDCKWFGKIIRNSIREASPHTALLDDVHTLNMSVLDGTSANPLLKAVWDNPEYQWHTNQVANFGGDLEKKAEHLAAAQAIVDKALGK